MDRAKLLEKLSFVAAMIPFFSLSSHDIIHADKVCAFRTSVFFANCRWF